MRQARFPVHDRLSAKEGDAPVTCTVQPAGNYTVRTLDLGPLCSAFFRWADVLESGSAIETLAREPPVRLGPRLEEVVLAMDEEGQKHAQREPPEDVLKGGLSKISWV